MSNNPTKILQYDLDPKIIQIIKDLIQLQGSYSSLYDRLTHINSELFDVDVKAVIDDLIQGYENGSVLTIQRIETLKTTLEKSIADTSTSLSQAISNVNQNLTQSISTNVTELNSKIESLQDDDAGNYNETYQYEAVYGNVVKHTSTGDKEFVIDYVYSDLASGKLNYSEKTFTNSNGETVKVKKTYTYDGAGNITGTTTVTTIV